MSIRPVIVLGMHRSGTSCLAGCLEQAGLFLGHVNTEAPCNLKGNRENRNIANVNDNVLATAGGSWDAPPEAHQGSVIPWSAHHASVREKFIALYPANKLWGFKDPRTLLTLEGWLTSLPNAQLVGTFRHPMAVAHSLSIRNGFPTERGLALWATYNQRLLEAHRQAAFPIVCFDWDATRYVSALDTISHHLGLHPPKTGFTFFENTLRHNSTSELDELPRHIQAIYDDLKDASEG